MSVFEPLHQQTIDDINSDGWRYLSAQANRIAKDFGGIAAVDEDSIGLGVGEVRVAIEQGDPKLTWTMPHVRYPQNVFSQGFRLSVNASAESTSNVVICKPFDWYLLCMSLNAGLNMAELGLAAEKNVDA